MKRVGFIHAFRGVYIAFRRERNIKIHFAAVVCVVAAGICGDIEPWAWAALTAAFALVLGSEMLNSALERLCDRITEQSDTRIRDIKDMSSGAVLLCAFFAVAIGVVVFARPEILESFQRTVERVNQAMQSAGVAS